MDARFLRARVVALLTAVAALCLALSGAAAQAASRHAVRVGAPPRVPPSATRVGAVSPSASISLTVALRPRDSAALAAYAAAVSDPGSPSYHHYLSVAEFARRFGAPAARIAAVERALRAEGLRPRRVTANGLAIDVATTAARAERAFATRLERVNLRSGRRAFVNTVAPALPANIAGDVEAVIGLDSLAHPVSQARPFRAGERRSRAVAPRVASGPQPCPTATTIAGSQPSTTYLANQLAAAYGIPSLYGAGDVGAGQTIAIYELESNFPSDIAAYQACYGTNASVSYVPVDGGSGVPDAANYDGLESELDIEDVIGLAPAANIIVYQGPNSSTSGADGPYDTYNAIVSQDRAQVVSTSWGECEALIGAGEAAAENNLFEEAAVQGQTIVAASGDAGSSDCYTANGSLSPLAVDDPASQPFVTGVGGTSLTVSPARTETVWNHDGGASGGGVSSLWPMPAYQSAAPASLGVINANSSGGPCNQVSGYCREVPDVSADADPSTGVLVYWDGNGSPTDGSAWLTVGGTSAAAPTWAALMALINDSAGCAGTPVGFANPALYRSAATAYASDFYDVTSGNNAQVGALFPATPGYDMASGLGTPNAQSLPATLCAETLRISNPGPQTSTVASGTNLQVRTTGATGATRAFSAKNLPPGLVINAATGVVSGQPTTPGAYQATVSVTDGQGSVATTTFLWTVVPVTVTVDGVAGQVGHVGVRVHLAVRASDNNGGALAYRASGLPPGLQVARTSGLISGTPSRPGQFTVTVTAADGSVTSSTTFAWTVTGRPSVSHAALSGAASGTPTLALTLAAGRLEPALRRVQIVLPRGLSFSSAARRARGLAVRDSRGRRLAFTITASGGRLVLVLANPVSSLRVSISALSVTRGTAAAIARGQLRTVSRRVRTPDAGGWQPTLVLRLRAR